MAPTKPSKRPSIRSKTSRPIPSTSSPSSSSRPSASTPSTKRDKRTIKHTTFVSKIEKKSTSSSSTSRLRRRRPSAQKQLVSTLESLADALPASEAKDPHAMQADATIRPAKSLKSRPGAMKRKEKLEKMERERFGKNMAQLATAESGANKEGGVVGGSTGGNGGESKGVWASLRAFIGQTMERKSEFATTATTTATGDASKGV